MREVIEAVVSLLRNEREALLCQVVETRGSTPQKAGALMLVEPAGGQVGTLGGGCVEAEVKQRAIQSLAGGGANLHSFLLDHDLAWADGLICGGRMQILAQAFGGPQALRYFECYLDQIEAGRGFIERVVLDSTRAGGKLGDRALWTAEGQRAAALHDGCGPAWSDSVDPVGARPRPAVVDGAAILPVLPRIRLLIVGAGHVGQAVAELAARSDFDVWVIDDRARFASQERFPAATHRLVGPIGEVLRGLAVDSATYALIVTRGHGHDQEALGILAATQASYVGLIGSRRKLRLIFDTLLEEGVSEAALARVSSPVGLPIGGESVFEIAISIVSELIARRNVGPAAAVGNRLLAQSPVVPEVRP